MEAKGLMNCRIDQRTFSYFKMHSKNAWRHDFARPELLFANLCRSCQYLTGYWSAGSKATKPPIRKIARAEANGPTQKNTPRPTKIVCRWPRASPVDAEHHTDRICNNGAHEQNQDIRSRGKTPFWIRTGTAMATIEECSTDSSHNWRYRCEKPQYPAQSLHELSQIGLSSSGGKCL